MRLIGMNSNRAGWAEKAIRTFMNETGVSELDGWESVLGDLVADIRHFCAREDVDWRVVLDKSDNHYDDEHNLCVKCKCSLDVLCDGHEEDGEICCEACRS